MDIDKDIFVNFYQQDSDTLYQSMLLESAAHHQVIDIQSCQNQPSYWPFVRHRTSDKMAVIIDPRFDDLMCAVIYNFMYHMSPKGWNLLIVSHPSFEDIARSLYPYGMFYAIDEKMIYYKDNEPNINAESYNRIMFNIKFWEMIPAENIAIFQKDCVMYKMFEDIFLEYDYAGANYYSSTNATFFHGGINGGFSLRKKSVMIDCLKNVNLDMINNYVSKMCVSLNKTPFAYSANICEDVYFTWACEILNKNVPDLIHRNRLAIECECGTYYFPSISYLPSVYHGWNKKYHDKRQALIFLAQSPYFLPCVLKFLEQQKIEKINKIVYNSIAD